MDRNRDFVPPPSHGNNAGIATHQVSDTQINSMANHYSEYGSYSGAVANGWGVASGIIGGFTAGREFWNTSPPLDNTECIPDFSQDLSSDITVSCNGEPSCEQCFETAFEKLNFYRRQLARLRCIYNSTKDYKDAAVAFGDNTSGIHAMAGIAWQNERAKIMRNFENTKSIYDSKSLEFLTGLQTTLRELSTCMYISGENNWYAKSGFIYFEFMQERYKRND